MSNLLLWFRNDLRIDDNEALAAFLAEKDNHSSSKALFFISEKQWKQHDWSEIKIDFITRHIPLLSSQLASFNIELMIVKADSFKDQIEFLSQYNLNHPNLKVFANSEPELNEHNRDQALIAKGLQLKLFECDVIVPKGALLTKSDQMYKVFSPFKKAWLKYVKENGFQYISKSVPEQTNVSSITAQGPSRAWPLSEQFINQQLTAFLNNKLDRYAQDRDFPGIKGTSGCSAYLAAGLISPRMLLSKIVDRYPNILVEHDQPYFSWLNELIWREFYRHLIYAFPRLCRHQCFNLKYQHIYWPNNNYYFEKWCAGKTGYPLVDAAMRQLNQTGWMHNRLRMLVASFLSKHLLIDWRLGEKYFMQRLIDGDLAANNGGWQWAASTGCDAQPYFRVFNPITQSERFDPDGKFIRKYIPELVDIPSKHIHFPHKYIKENNLQGYWPAIVEHKQARMDAIAFYK